jgi:hypothetical protein
MYFVNSQGQRERVNTQQVSNDRDNQSGRDETDNDAMSNENEDSECPFLARECMGLKVSDILLILLILIVCGAGIKYFSGKGGEKAQSRSSSSRSSPETQYGFRFY